MPGPQWQASWASGLGAVEPGYATYSTNAVESLRFGIKHLMDNAPKQDVAEAMVQAASAVQSRVDRGFYSSIKGHIEDLSRVQQI